MELSVAHELNRVLMFELPMLVLYVDICILFICIDSISMCLVGLVASVGLGLGGCLTWLV